MISTERDTPFAAALRTVTGATQALMTTPLAAGDDSLDHLARLRSSIDTLETIFCRLTACVDAGGTHTEQTYEFMRRDCHMTGTAALRSLTVASQLHAIPASSQALAEGRIGFSHLTHIAATAAALRSSPTASPFDEQALLLPALRETVFKFRRTCQHLRHSLDPAGYAHTHNRAVEQRYLHITDPDDEGLVFIDGRLDSVGGAVLRTALEPLAARLGSDDHRLKERRMMDALLEIAEGVLQDGGLSTRPTRVPHLQVTTTLETLMALPGSPAADLEFSLPITSQTVQRLACECSVSRILLGSDSLVIDVGRARRVPGRGGRRALQVRDRTCVWPAGCSRPASRCIPHHLDHWATGGSGDLPNQASLCRHHHYLVHEGGWQFLRTSDGAWRAIPPNRRL